MLFLPSLRLLPKRNEKLVKDRGDLIDRYVLDNEWQIGTLFSQKIQVDQMWKDPLSKRWRIGFCSFLMHIFEVRQHEAVLELLEEGCDALFFSWRQIQPKVVKRCNTYSKVWG